MAATAGRRRLAAALFVAALAALGAAFYLLRPEQSRADGHFETLRSAAAALPGKVTEARSKIDPGKSEKAVLEALGKPSAAVETKGAERHTVWTYTYADGNLTLNMTDGYLVRVDTELGPTRRGLKRE